MSPCSLRRGCVAAGVAAALVIPLSCAWAYESLPDEPHPCQIQSCSSPSANAQPGLIDSHAWRLALLERALQPNDSGNLMEYDPPKPAKAPSSSERNCANAVSAINLTPLCTAPTPMRSRVGVTHSLTGEVLATTDISTVNKSSTLSVRRQRLASTFSGAKVRPVHDDASDAQVVEAVLGHGMTHEEEDSLMLNDEQRRLIRQLRTSVHHL